jgi:hypothetical protein
LSRRRSCVAWCRTLGIHLVVRDLDETFLAYNQTRAWYYSRARLDRTHSVLSALTLGSVQTVIVVVLLRSPFHLALRALLYCHLKHPPTSALETHPSYHPLSISPTGWARQKAIQTPISRPSPNLSNSSPCHVRTESRIISPLFLAHRTTSA